MICRKDTIGYIEFIRGKYQLHARKYIKNIIFEMTTAEKNRIQTTNFDILWKELWGDNVSNHFNEEQYSSREKFDSLKNGVIYGTESYNLQTLINESMTEDTWDDAEWGFPKGRHNNNEKDLMCALRELEEETGYSRYSLKVVQNLLPLEEIFTGSNYKSYKHKYYVAQINYIDTNVNNFQTSEVSKVEWKTFDEGIKSIRPYNLEKKDVLNRVNKLLLEYRLYP
jgi:8-oxo-dGTP pyrophosphatase MutT (NUDIX family)